MHKAPRNRDSQPVKLERRQLAGLVRLTQVYIRSTVTERW
jgi:hypothetical protein